MKQTAVEWLGNELVKKGFPIEKYGMDLFEQAKQMEKQQIIDAFVECQEDMADKKYTELQLRFFANELIKGVEEKNKQGYEDIKVDYESLILSLNKQN